MKLGLRMVRSMFRSEEAQLRHLRRRSGPTTRLLMGVYYAGPWERLGDRLLRIDDLDLDGSPKPGRVALSDDSWRVRLAHVCERMDVRWLEHRLRDDHWPADRWLR